MMAPWAETCCNMVWLINSVTHSEMWASCSKYCCIWQDKQNSYICSSRNYSVTESTLLQENHALYSTKHWQGTATVISTVSTNIHVLNTPACYKSVFRSLTLWNPCSWYAAVTDLWKIIIFHFNSILRKKISIMKKILFLLSA
jgi:hypothetical protein